MAMDGEGFGWLHAAFAVDLHHVVEERKRFLRNSGAGLFQATDRVRKTFRDRLIEIFQRRTLHDTDAQTSERCRLERHKVFACHHGVSLGAGFDRARDRSDRVDTVGQRESAVGWDALPAWLVADDAAERAGYAARSAGVGADRDLAHAVGSSHGRARRRATGNALAVGRISGSAEMRIGTD